MVSSALYRIEMGPTERCGIWKLQVKYSDYLGAHAGALWVKTGSLSELYTTLGELVLQYPQTKENT